MFKTIKPIKEYWSKKIPFLKYGRPNPLQVFSNDEEKFSKAMETFKFKQVVKQTGAERHSRTQTFLKEWIKTLEKSPVILDIGASDGSTSLRLMDLIDDAFNKYYVTDYNISCDYFSTAGYTYFFNQESECFLVASNKFVFYPSDKWLFDFLFKKQINRIASTDRKELLLINRNLQNKSQKDERIEIMQHNIFEPWAREKADIIIVANLLNRYYFKDEEIVKALERCYEAMSDGAILAIIRNLPTEEGGEVEKANIYRKNVSSQSFESIHEINGGIEFSELLLSLRFSQK